MNLTEFFEKFIIESFSVYNTPFRDFWLVTLFVFRFLAVEIIGENIFKSNISDEGDEGFNCLTDVKACTQQCYNRFIFMDHTRLWHFQVLFFSLPMALFYFVASFYNSKYHTLSKESENLPENSAEYTRNLRKIVKYSQLENRYHIMKDVEEENKKQVTWHPNMGRLYMCLCIVLIGMEFGSLYAVYSLNVWQNKKEHFWESWMIPRDYTCTIGADLNRNSCTDPNVRCFLDKSNQKTLFMRYIVSIQVFSIVLLVGDFFYAVIRFPRSSQSYRNRVFGSQSHIKRENNEFGVIHESVNK
ncbi:Oidioi.mRNA.OKI2018_I69.chr1.g1955.t1.cds [Oikopleura dioica]|uniref:Oidioi.mRNA.OKI2018_I69.chr1.g1955.t1.cds n=1 Tax=Oikopleura dioica TaxID=34765 RepID=A0ABN7SUV2_OIKDI|nr:Oidioi.mRNA.OKI2018_I69.chr1.g1955.t1.cds [Oikopleura dioica]